MKLINGGKSKRPDQVEIRLEAEYFQTLLQVCQDIFEKDYKKSRNNIRSVTKAITALAFAISKVSIAINMPKETLQDAIGQSYDVMFEEKP